MKPPLHPVVVDSDAMSAFSKITGLTWDELADVEVIWFMNRGMKPEPRVGPYDSRVVFWRCFDPFGCGWVSPIGGGGSSRLKQAVRQHLRDRHGIERKG
ncbi:MAG TPA: hypothetical protein VK204_14495 [Nocardioidaceae bacterium]|nr:hypothetical protein [Nocardioidaceae bacterium]